MSKLLQACKLSYENVLCVLKNKSKKNLLRLCRSWRVHNTSSGWEQHAFEPLHGRVIRAGQEQASGVMINLQTF